MRVMAIFSTSFFAKYLHRDEDGPGRGHLCHTDTFLVYLDFTEISSFYHDCSWGVISQKVWLFEIFL